MFFCLQQFCRFAEAIICNIGLWRNSVDTLYLCEEFRWAEFTGEIAFDLFPIPQSYIDLNTEAEMTQNKGW